jgi:predicted amidophosphoribosyltransferase
MASFKCPKCQAATSGDADFCPHCGTPWTIVCPKCGGTWRFFYQYKFCPSCGERVAKQEAKV